MFFLFKNIIIFHVIVIDESNRLASRGWHRGYVHRRGNGRPSGLTLLDAVTNISPAGRELEL